MLVLMLVCSVLSIILQCPFSRIQEEDQRRVDGTGLGLYLSSKLAELLHWEITVESRYGAGSEFTFRMPAG